MLKPGSKRHSMRLPELWVTETPPTSLILQRQIKDSMMLLMRNDRDTNKRLKNWVLTLSQGMQDTWRSWKNLPNVINERSQRLTRLTTQKSMSSRVFWLLKKTRGLPVIQSILKSFCHKSSVTRMLCKPRIPFAPNDVRSCNFRLTTISATRTRRWLRFKRSLNRLEPRCSWESTSWTLKSCECPRRSASLRLKETAW